MDLKMTSLEIKPANKANKNYDIDQMIAEVFIEQEESTCDLTTTPVPEAVE